MAKQFNSGDILTAADMNAIVTDAEAIKGEVSELKGDLANSKKAIAELNDKKITKFYTNNLGETTLNDSDNGKIVDMFLYGKSEQFSGEIELKDGTTVTVPSPEHPQEIKSVVNPKLRIVGGTKGALLTEVQYNTLTTTLNSYLDDRFEIYYIPKNNQGFNNCIIIILDGTNFKSIYPLGNLSSYTSEKWITILRNLGILLCSSTVDPKETIGYGIEPQTASLPYTLNAIPVTGGGNVTIDGQQYIADYVDIDRKKIHRLVDSSKLDPTVSIIDNSNWLLSAEEVIDITDEEVQAFKELATYYHTTNVMVTSDQLDGYTTFNYPISLANGWNYVKEQLGDTREYIYDMELQSAEAYVNSEYAVALTELEV